MLPFLCHLECVGYVFRQSFDLLRLQHYAQSYSLGHSEYSILLDGRPSRDFKLLFRSTYLKKRNPPMFPYSNSNEYSKHSYELMKGSIGVGGVTFGAREQCTRGERDMPEAQGPDKRLSKSAAYVGFLPKQMLHMLRHIVVPFPLKIRLPFSLWNLRQTRRAFYHHAEPRASQVFILHIGDPIRID